VDDKVHAFLERNHSAAVATIKADGTPHVARIGIGLIGDVVWSSGTRNRVRTRNLRRDPRATLFVFDPRRWQSWMGIESHVRILDGPDAPEQNLRLYRALAGEPDDVEEYLAAMVLEERLIYEFTIDRTYGQY
jgi:PPOX class probable F420-dependent enzyme